MAGFKQALKDNPDLKVFNPVRHLNRDNRLQSILDKDVVTKRLIRERKEWKDRRHNAVTWVKKSEKKLATLKKQRRELKKKLTAKNNEIKRTETVLDRNREKRNTANRKLLGIRSSLTSRRLRLMHNAKGLIMREAYKEIGLPMPKRLQEIKNLAIFKEETKNENNTDRESG